MADVPIISNQEKRVNEAVCIDTKRIYDSCVSRACLEDLNVTFSEEAQTLIDDAATVKCREASIDTVSIEVDEVPFNRGYYNVDITFRFLLQFDTYSAPGATPQVAEGYTEFNKKCILYGSEGNVKIFTSTANQDALDVPESPQYVNPIAKVQAVDPVVLSSEVLDGALPTDDKSVLVTLGLFSIVQMERDVQLLMPAYDYCIPEKECSCSTEDPCTSFQSIDFPVDEFFPPEKEITACSEQK